MLCLALAGEIVAAPAPAPLPSPYYREAEFYRHQSQPLLALGSLLAAQRQNLLKDDETDVAELLLGQLYREYDLPGQAADSFQRASGAGVGSLRGRAWWELAVQRYRRGDYERANAALARTTGLLPYELEKQRPQLQAQILLALNRNTEAAALLNAWQPVQSQDAYTRYNIGVALMRAGDLLQGSGLLDSVGTMPAPDRELQALRDQANLAMGYGFLRADQGATARPIFRRVSLEGPYSNLALLGAGWAELAPDGKRQQNLYKSPVGCVEDPSRVLPETMLVLRRPPRDACDRERTFKMRAYFEQSPGAGSEAERYRRALVPWQTLIRRNPADPAVQEALLAVPYAFSRIQGREQAIEHYRSAIRVYENERDQLARATGIIRETLPQNAAAGSLPARGWSLPRAEDGVYLASLVASDPFQATLQDLQALRTLDRTLQPMQTRLAGLDSQIQQDSRMQDRPDLPQQTDVSITTASAADSAPVPATTGQRITYFGVFDFVPPTSPAEIPPSATPTPVEPENDETGTAEPALGSAFEWAPPPRKPRPRAHGPAPRERHAQLQSRLQAMQKLVNQTEREYVGVLRQMALAEISAQQERIDIYLARARFALAQLLDPAVTDRTGP